jgi:tRNA threonylcarbamoyladenosine biosynthesis protein TsaB
MRVLALDTTSRAGSVSVLDGERVLIERSGDPSRSQAERLPRELLDALADAAMTVRDVDLYAVASGPGSFTGLRIGLAAIQGMAMVTGRRVVAVSALDALAAAAASRLTMPARVGTWIDALRDDVFSALYDVAPGAGQRFELMPLEEPHVERPADSLARWRDRGAPPAVVIGDGAVRYGALLDGIARIEPAPVLAPFIAQLAALRVNHATSPAGVQPLYVRRTDVELARDRAAARGGGDAGTPQE